ncbi:MAG: caspase family protein, partial [Lewinellaceae bacterium]|nr:caspase family protein [Lewinellaceae bacterium]
MKTQLFFPLLLGCLPILVVAQKPRLVMPLGHHGGINSVAFSPAGQHVLTGSSEGTAKLWDFNGRELQTFTVGASNVVFSVAFSPSGQQVLTGSEYGTAKLWDLNGRELQTFTRHEGPVFSVAFSPSGQQVLTGSSDGTAKLWDLNGRVLQTFPVHDNWNWGLPIAFSPSGRHVLTGSDDGTAKLWDLSGREMQTFTGDGVSVDVVAFSPSRRQILTVSSPKISGLGPTVDVSYKLWDLGKRGLQTFGDISVPSPHISVAFSPSGQQVLMENQGLVKLWNLSEWELQTFFGDEEERFYSVAFSPSGQQVLTISEEGTAKLWDLSGRELQTFSGPDHSVSSGAFSPSGQQVLTGGNDGTAKLWDLSGRELQTFPGDEEEWVYSVAFSPSGQQVLTISEEGTAKLWDLSGRKLKTFSVHEEEFSVAFSPTGEQILTWNRDFGILALWDLRGRKLKPFFGDEEEVYSFAFSPLGQQFMTINDGIPKLWDLNGRELQTFTGHTGYANSAVFSPDGQYLLTGGSEGVTKIWNLRGQELASLISLDEEDWVVLSPTGLFDASPGAMNQLYFVVGGQEVIELEQLKDRYYEPELLAKIMQFSSDPIREVSGLDSIALYPLTALQLDTVARQLRIRLTPRAGGVGKVSVFINGKEVISEANPVKGYAKTRDTVMTIALDTYARYFLTDTLNHITIRAYHAEGWLKSPPQTVDYWYFPRKAKGRSDAGSKGSALLRPNPVLYVIAVGTSNYSGENLDLKYPDQDARQMAAAFQQVGSRLFGSDSTRVTLLTTDAPDPALQPTKTNIQAAFEAFREIAKAEDILVVYFSGHGVSYGDADQAQFYYLTKDISSDNLSDEAIRSRRTISNEELTQWVTGIPAQKQILILDACNSGRVVESLSAGKKDLNSAQIRALDRMRDRTGMFVLAGSAADMVSYEAGQYGQGLLTYSLLEGMSGLALTPDKRVDVSTLFEYSRNRVPELATDIGGVQTPML